MVDSKAYWDEKEVETIAEMAEMARPDLHYRFDQWIRSYEPTKDHCISIRLREAYIAGYYEAKDEEV